MSLFNCLVVEVRDIIPIYDADAIELAHVLGYQCVVAKAEGWKAGDRGCFVPPDAIVDTTKPEFSFLNKKAKPDGKFRIKTIRLRGVISQGLLLHTDAELGTDLSELLGVTKYEPPPPTGIFKNTDTLGPLPSHLGSKYDIENFQRFPHVLYKKDWGKFVVTEKLEGTNALYYLKDDHFGVCSHSRELKEGDSVYWRLAKKYDIENKLRSTGRNDIAIRGEIVGPGIQKNIYKLNEHELFVFDAQVNGQYVDFDVLMVFYRMTGLFHVPIICYTNVFPEEEMVRYSTEKSTMCDHLREGVVWRPLIEATDPELGRVILKVKSPEYEL